LFFFSSFHIKKDYFANCEETLEMATRLFDQMYFKELNDLKKNVNSESFEFETNNMITDNTNYPKCDCINE